MAGLVYNLGDPEVVNVWENTLEREVRARDPLLDPDSGLAGTSPDSLIQQKDELTDGPGAFIRTKLRYQLDGRGRAGDEVLKGHSMAYQTATDDVYVNTVRNAFAISSPIVQQYIQEDAMVEGRDGLADWFASRFALACHAHAAGISIITDDAYRLHNTIDALNSTYIIRPNGKTAGNLTSSDTFDIDLINEAARLVKMLRPKIRPAMTKYGPRYCVFLSPEQVFSLRESNSEWFAKMALAAQGGRIDDNGLWTRALGEDQGFLFFESDFVPPGLNSGGTAFKANTRRAWIGGAQALFMAFGRGWKVAPGYSLNRFQWSREAEDFNHQHELAATTITGVSRPRYQKPGEASPREHGVIVIETYADHGQISAADAFKDYVDATGGLAVEA